MSVVVAYKWAADPGDGAVDAEGTVDWSRAKFQLSEYDPVALALAAELGEATGQEVVGISVGPATLAGPMAKKAALSRGPDRLLLVADDSAPAGLTATGHVLAALARRAGAAIVLAGDASVDESARMVPPILAGYLGWPCFQGVSDVAPGPAGWRLTQQVGGTIRTVEVARAVVALAPDARPTRIPGMKDILAAGKKPAEVVPLAELAPAPLPARVTGRSKPPARPRKHQLFSGPGAAADLARAIQES